VYSRVEMPAKVKLPSGAVFVIDGAVTCPENPEAAELFNGADGSSVDLLHDLAGLSGATPDNDFAIADYIANVTGGTVFDHEPAERLPDVIY
jgi:hypothetical protein